MKKQFTVAILGRPNVGKSTLFNRLIKSKKSITSPVPGVTRDVISGNFELDEDTNVKLFDTGGLTDEGDLLNDYTQKKSLEALETADIILFLVEANLFLPIETEYIKLLRKSQKKAILVMNKSDSPEKDIYINDFYKYGIGEPIPISAAHNRNIDILLEKLESELLDIEKEHKMLDSSQEDYSDINIAIVGKPNVGKSSLLNKITGKDRSIVSDVAGTTRDVIDEIITFDEKKIKILDTAGIRRKSKVKEDIEYYSVNRAIKAIENADVTILVIDSLDNISDQDKKITDQIVKNGKGLIIALNKIDLLEDEKEIKEKKEKLSFKFPIIAYAPIIPISALQGRGIKNLLKQAIEISSQLNLKITTSQLNEFIQKILRRYAPSSKKGVLKIFYGTQTSSNPIKFVFFINKKSLLPESYKQYIINRLREDFGFTGVPIKLIFRAK